ncbi:Protein EXORDIUM-like 2 [Hibiscus syriacus]|uniref:Protein EXORDIUM-like 2 n=1 Tax=Hibiscus syriacus TaxID=106335 RepID=A0A6A3CZX5_HIBSY|nr:Protein EXORDIUM-like 2 [Hibiscus syriacus]
MALFKRAKSLSISYGTASLPPSQRSVIVDFINSLSFANLKLPSTSSWWKTTEKYKSGSSTLVVGKQVLLENYLLGKTLKNSHLPDLVGKFNTISIILTNKDVAVEGFCMRCGTYRSIRGLVRSTFICVGNSKTQCPDQCAWPFHRPIYGPQTPPLVAPNRDVGGSTNAPLKAVSAYTEIFGSGSYPIYPSNLLVEKTTGASYNANAVNGRKYLFSAMW